MEEPHIHVCAHSIVPASEEDMWVKMPLNEPNPSHWVDPAALSLPRWNLNIMEQKRIILFVTFSNSWPRETMYNKMLITFCHWVWDGLLHTNMGHRAYSILVNSPFIQFFENCPVWWGCLFPDGTLWDTKGIPQKYHMTKMNKLLQECKVKRIHFQLVWAGKPPWRQEPCLCEVPNAQWHLLKFANWKRKDILGLKKHLWLGWD